MKRIGLVAAAVVGATLLPGSGSAQTAPPTPPSINTPDKVESSIGPLQYKDGVPSKETVAKAYDFLDLMRGVEAFVNAYQGASVSAIFKGMEEAGIPNNTALIFSELMDAKSLFLTANADTIYFWVNLDATKGPIVVETPPLSLGVVDDMWFQWVTDFGLPGPDRGEGGKYLFVPPDYKGELPAGGYYVQQMRTTRATLLGRSFLENNDPKPVAAQQTKNSQVAYVYADPIVCQCVYFGNQAAYAQYRQMVFQKRLADERQMTAAMNQDAFDFGPWDAPFM